MKKEVTGSAGLLALLALMVHTQFPGSEPRTSGGAAVSSAKREAVEKPATDEEAPEGPWLASRGFFYKAGSPFIKNGSPCADDAAWEMPCFASDVGQPVKYPELRTLMGLDHPEAYETWSIIASVPDPQHTRLSLATDRDIEAMQRALQTEGWQFSRQWLPWLDRVDSSETKISDRRKERRLQRQQEQMPGLLVFQRVPNANTVQQVLFVFLVGDSPTAGVSGSQFLIASHLASALTDRPERPADQRVRLLMPSFSGSLMSLARLLKLLESQPAGRESLLAGTIFAGHVSSRPEVAKFNRLAHRELRSGISAASDYKKVFCHTLDLYGIKGRDAAILTEDDTVYGQAFDTDCDITTYTYSRDISHLRNTYIDEEGADSVEKRNFPQAGVAFSVKDSANGEDSVPVFADGQAPLSQNAVLSSISDELRRKRTRLVYIVATNPLDALFLTRVMRHEAPDTRIVLDNSDILFLPAAAQYPLSGTVFFSTYPNFIEGNRWLATARENHITFPDDTSQGQYNAALALACELGIGSGGKSHVQAHPGIWTLLLGRRGFLPVDLTDPHKLKDFPQRSHEAWFVSGDSAASTAYSNMANIRFPPPPRVWFVVTGFTIALMLVGTWLLLNVNLSGTPVWPFWLYVPRGVHATQPVIAPLACIALAVSACEFCLLFPAVVSRFNSPLYAFPEWLMFIGPLVFLTPLMAVADVWRRRRAKIGRGQGLTLAIATLLWLLVLIFWSRSCLLLDGQASRLFCYRALEIESGASPTLPFLALAAAAAAGGLYYARRLALCGPRRPQLPVSVLGTVPLEEPYEAINQRLALAVRRSGGGRAVRLVLAIAGGTGIYLWLKTYAAAFEQGSYNNVVVSAVLILLFGLLVACEDFVEIYWSLMKLLQLIDLLPLRDSFAKSSEDIAEGPLWNRRISEKFTIKRMTEALSKRHRLTPNQSAAGDLARFAEASPAVLVPGQARTCISPEALLDDLADLEDVSSGVAKSILENDLQPRWSENVPVPVSDWVSGDEYRHSALLTDLVVQCSDFVAIQFARYLTWVLIQMRLIALWVSVALVILMAMLNLYSPQAPQILGRLLAVLFLLLSVIVFRILAAMERNPVLSRINGTNPGELNQEFWLRVIGIGILPLAGVLSHLFPAVSGYVAGWLGPGIEAIR